MQETKSNTIDNAYSILLAGGVGTRLWPVSRDLYPKQLAKFMGKDSLIQNTVKRLSPVLSQNRIKVICGTEHYHEIARHLKWIDVDPDKRIISEPCGRNTAPAILLGVLNIIKTEKDPLIFVFPADHIIKEISEFHEMIKIAASVAQKGYIITFGIKPDYPETGYGYIEGVKINGEEQALKVKQFVEKPDKQTAAAYIEAGNFFWNSGMFAFKASVIIEEFKKFQPELYNRLTGFLLSNKPLTEKEYKQLDDISIDFAIMENTDKSVVLPSDFGWSDIGSWKSLYDFLPKDKNNNVIEGNVIINNTRNSFIMGQKRLIAANHLENIVVVETPDSIFVSDIENSRNVKAIVKKLKKEGRIEHHQHQTVFYPWGTKTIIDEKKDSQTNQLVIYPGLTYETETETGTLNHIIVLGESVDILTANKKESLKKGDSIIVSNNIFIKINNPNNNNACVMLVNIKITGVGHKIGHQM